jgi:hypothetical protein
MNQTGNTTLLPKFSRKMWVSDRAREAWEWKIIAIAEAWRQTEWLTVVDNVRECAAFWASQTELASLSKIIDGYGLRASPLIWRTHTVGNQQTLLYRVAIGKPKELQRFRRAWKAGDDDALGALFGYPACCRAFFRKVFVLDGLVDGTWPMAVSESNIVEVSGMLELNPFWHPLGVRLTPHAACRFDCEQSVTLARKFCESARRHGHAREIEETVEILQWPVEWSSLHGIAETRTPILKMMQNTDSCVHKRVIRRSGNMFPDEGARGICFALKSPRKSNVTGGA